jgi:hypothetical protein
VSVPLEGVPPPGLSAARRAGLGLLGAGFLAVALALGPRAVDSLSDRGLFRVRPAAPAEAPVPALTSQTVVGAATGSGPVGLILAVWGARLVLLAALAALGARLVGAALLGSAAARTDRARRRKGHGPPEAGD